jgi:hypothetical protein
VVSHQPYTYKGYPVFIAKGYPTAPPFSGLPGRMIFFFGGKSKPLIVAPVTSLADAAQRRLTIKMVGTTPSR